jgi:hypothetical protein
LFLALFYLKNLNFLYNNVKFRWVCPRWDYILLEGGGGVTYAVRAGAPHSVVYKCMRVKTEAMVGYYATLTSKELRSASDLAF